jgi:hypothetical protein
VIVPNGCGSGATQAKITSLFAPYTKVMTSCCDSHDQCYGKCGGPHFTASFNSCNSAFKSCMYSKCKSHTSHYKGLRKPIELALCKAQAYSFWQLCNAAGRLFYSNSQKKHCGCRNAATTSSSTTTKSGEANSDSS